MRHHLPSVAHQHGQQFVLNRREMDRLLGDRHLPPHAVNVQLSDSQHWRTRLLRGMDSMTQRHTDARQQFSHAEGLGQVVIGASIEGGNLIRFSVTHRKDNDGDVRPRTQPPCDLQTVEIR